MTPEPRVKLLTGGPGVGKPAIVQEVAATVGDGAASFYIQEILRWLNTSPG